MGFRQHLIFELSYGYYYNRNHFRWSPNFVAPESRTFASLTCEGVIAVSHLRHLHCSSLVLMCSLVRTHVRPVGKAACAHRTDEGSLAGVGASVTLQQPESWETPSTRRAVERHCMGCLMKSAAQKKSRKTQFFNKDPINVQKKN